MAFQTVFKRYELKYMITNKQKQKILQAIAPYIKPDKYGKTTIRNIYFDTDNYLLIRRSIEKPLYKEKLRVRSYQKADQKSTVFVELKKKYDHIVYKRRLALTEDTAMDWICNRQKNFQDTQISKEIDYFINYYQNLHPTAFLSYEREAYYSKEDYNFRITFDNDIKCRYVDLSLKSDVWGNPLLKEDQILMEIKCAGGMPLWMVEILSKEKIYRTSFSKYGTAYKDILLPNFKEEILHGKIIQRTF